MNPAHPQPAPTPNILDEICRVAKWPWKDHAPVSLTKTDCEFLERLLAERNAEVARLKLAHDLVSKDANDAGLEVLQLRASIRAAEERAGKAAEKLAYVHSMGLRFGMMKSSDKPEPYLMHTWTEDSNHERMFREWSHSIGWEHTVDRLKGRLSAVAEEIEKTGTVEALRSCRTSSVIGEDQYPVSYYDAAKVLSAVAALTALLAKLREGGAS